MKAHKLGILTGISYVSGLDYFKGINEAVLAGTPPHHLMSPNPSIVMASVDCDEYVHLLTLESFSEVDKHLLAGVRQLVASGCDTLVIASNTGHICVPAIEKASGRPAGRGEGRPRRRGRPVRRGGEGPGRARPWHERRGS